VTGDGDNLFRAVCENPADDMPRLVYADWLQENGHPERAEFIRLQCEAWHLCPAYATVNEARTAASRLLKEHGDDWYSELPEVPGVAWSNLFVRGFVDTAWVEPQRDVWAQVSPLFLATPLQHLVITNCRLGFLQALLGLTEIERLKTLQLRGLPNSAAGRRLLADAARQFPGTTFL
jgi:uncharacterized protein (TIGR02996 family)